MLTRGTLLNKGTVGMEPCSVQENGVLGPIVGIVGSMAALEVLKAQGKRILEIL